MPRKVFTAGEILTAADVNTNLMDQAVMVFDDSAARGSAIPTPSEGMVTYLKDTDRLEQFDGTNFVVAAPPQTGVLQVVSTAKTDVFTTASPTFVDVTGFAVTITPSSASSKVLVLVNAFFGSANFGAGVQTLAKLLRDSTAIAGGADDRFYQTEFQEAGAGSLGNAHSLAFLDTPATTSAVTYKIQLASAGSSTATVNRTRDVTASSSSTITVMEVAG